MITITYTNTVLGALQAKDEDTLRGGLFRLNFSTKRIGILDVDDSQGILWLRPNSNFSLDKFARKIEAAFQEFEHYPSVVDAQVKTAWAKCKQEFNERNANAA